MSRFRGDGGQVVVEFALVLPVLVLLVLALGQVTVIVRYQFLVTHATREATRAVAVAGDRAAAGPAALASAPLDPGRLTVETAGSVESGRRVRVTVQYRAPTDVPLVGPLIPDVAVESSLVVRVE
jgi:Flp pilus assembly protein TadG